LSFFAFFELIERADVPVEGTMDSVSAETGSAVLRWRVRGAMCIWQDNRETSDGGAVETSDKW